MKKQTRTFIMMRLRGLLGPIAKKTKSGKVVKTNGNAIAAGTQ